MQTIVIAGKLTMPTWIDEIRIAVHVPAAI
jgi:hypothetical protein